MKRILLLCLMVCSLGLILAQTDVLPWGEEKNIRQADDFIWSNAVAAQSNGVVYVWSKVDSDRTNIYAQMKDVQGNTPWGNQPLLVNQDQMIKDRPQIVATSDNCYIIAWYAYENDNSSPQLVLQKINAQGQLLWAPQGVVVNGQNELTFSLKMISDDNGGVFLTWGSIPDNSNIKQIRAQHLSSAGNALWNEFGTVVNESIFISSDYYGICKNSVNGIFIVYLNNSSDVTSSTIVSASLDNSGTVIYQEQVVSDFASIKAKLQVIADNQGGFYVCWVDARDLAGIYTQRINSSGIPVFAQDVFVQTLTNSNPYLFNNVNSQNEEIILVSELGGYNLTGFCKYNKINSTGSVVTSALNLFQSSVDGLAGFEMLNDIFYVVCATNDTDSRKLVLQKINSEGTLLLGAAGYTLQTFSYETDYCPNLVNVSDHLVYTWIQYDNAGKYMNTKSCDLSGNSLGPITQIVTCNNNIAQLISLVGYSDHAFVIWREYNAISNDVPMQKLYFRKINNIGNMTPLTSGTLIGEAIHLDVKVTKNAAEGFTIYGFFSNTDNGGLYAKIYDASGVNTSGNPGKKICQQSTNDLFFTLIVKENNYTSILFRESANYPGSLRAQRLTGNTVAYPVTGHYVMDNPNFSYRMLDYKNNILFLCAFDSTNIATYKAFKLTDNYDLDPAWPEEGYTIFTGQDNYYYEPYTKMFATEEGIIFTRSDYDTDTSTNQVLLQKIDTEGNLVFPEGGYALPLSNVLDTQWNNGLEVFTSDNRFNLTFQKYTINGTQVTPLWEFNKMIFPDNYNYIYSNRLKISSFPGYTTCFLDDGGNPEINNPIHTNLDFNLIDDQGNVLAGDNGLQLSNSLESLVNSIKDNLIVEPVDMNTVYLAWTENHENDHGFYINYDKYVREYYYSNIKIQKINIQPLGTDNPINAPTTFKLNNNYPNPFNPETTISFNLPAQAKVELSVYNIKGQKVTNLVNETMPAGKHDVTWKGRGSSEKPVSSGVYFYKLTANGKSQIKKMLLMK